ncbi:L,D-transpeptidase family protein [Microbulbifer salipaludis]|uniref:L,D-transpeptidase family protein n=1 Tax=Microbulbifer salipaludis TaxID=187980 RepID=A0ABS3E481_9GAMM|nr:L,D-transpeptidase family protein [Microbulbifer salipaludis]MBN8430106.1 L,D-transpeptidase family protein [Microbulbifer salipaludis]
MSRNTMSRNKIAKHHCRRTRAGHFYTIVAASCCALMLTTEYPHASEHAAPPAPSTAEAVPESAPETVSEARRTAGADSAVDFATAGKILREQAARYRAFAGKWQPIDPGAPLRAGDQGPRVAQLRQLLQLFGDYTGQPGPITAPVLNPNRFDAGLQLAVESYQRRHGIPVSGIVGRATLKELARTPEELAQRLEVNAERWDKLPDNPGKRYILVNVPDYQLQLIEQQRVVLSMKTVVGKSSKRTPDLNTKVVSVVFNPTWTVPRSILLTDLLPKARNNPEAMHKRGYRVVRYGTNTTTPISDESIKSAASGKATLRQISGPGNTLGRVKFVIPNKQAIFLHDTQAQSLFEQHHRAYSHGCIRLEQPEELAYALLGPQGWDRTRVAQSTTGDESVTIKVEEPPKLFITYLTAWVDGLGKVQFRPDVYHRDK